MAAQPIEITDNSPGFRNLGEQLQAVMRAANYPMGRVDPRLEELQKRSHAAGGSEQVPSDGGFLVQPEFSRNLVDRMYDTGSILSRCLEMPMGRSELKLPAFSENSRAAGSRLGGVQFFWESEAQTAIASNPNFNTIDLTAKKVIGLIHLTNELATDSDALNAWANKVFVQEGTYMIESAIVNGTGAGQPLGVAKSPAVVNVAAELGQASGTVVNWNVQKMMAALWGPSWLNSVWLYNQQLLTELSGLTTIVGAAGSQSNSWQWSLADNEPNRLCGRPAFPSEYCPSPGNLGDLVLCDFSRYVVGMREKRGDVSLHVKFLSDEQTFRLVIRVDGQPLDQFPVTLENGGTTSPFVVLGARP